MDVLSILAPLEQCCKVRLSTVKKLLTFTPHSRLNSKKLSEEVRKSLQNDPSHQPILSDQHLADLDRRVQIIIKKIHYCISTAQNKVMKVIINDGI